MHISTSTFNTWTDSLRSKKYQLSATITNKAKGIVHVLLGLQRHDHTSDAFVYRKILNVKETNTHCSASFILKCLSSGNGVNERYSIRSNNIIDVPFMRSEQPQCGIIYHGPRIRNCATLQPFKGTLECYLMPQYEIWWKSVCLFFFYYLYFLLYLVYITFVTYTSYGLPLLKM